MAIPGRTWPTSPEFRAPIPVPLEPRGCDPPIRRARLGNLPTPPYLAQLPNPGVVNLIR